jgi:hypothetical protein
MTVGGCKDFLSDALATTKRKREGDPEVGYVYGSVSEASPGLILIGSTHNLILIGSTHNVITDRIVWVAPSYDTARDERVAHAYFSDRQEGGRYRVAVEELQEFFDSHISPDYAAGWRLRHTGSALS